MLSARQMHATVGAQRWGVSAGAGVCQPNAPALFRAPALLARSRVTLVESYYIEVLWPSDLTGTIESSGTIQLALHQYDASLRGKKGLKFSRDKNESTYCSREGGGRRRAWFAALDLSHV